CARPGVDTAFSEDQMKVGRKLATKLLNLTKFVLGAGASDASSVSAQPVDLVDQAMLVRLSEVVDAATIALEQFDYARALERTEAFFWWFCDDYVELVKTRAYGETQDSSSARASLHRA
ncbi:MAG: class I tRNA ligase family protein, partial [Acidimicrobiaceae bacterium]